MVQTVSEIHAILLMPQPIAYAADVAPRDFWHDERCFAAEPDGGFADNQQLSFYGGDGFGVLAERLNVHRRPPAASWK